MALYHIFKRVVLRFWVLILSLFGFSVSLLYAKGTSAGTAIDNQAQIHYALAGIDYNLTSNQNHFLVDQIVDLHLSWQDNTPIEVGAGDEGRVLIFSLTNLGNSTDLFSLTYEHNSSSDFSPSNPQIYIDSNANGIYDAGTDTLAADINLTADANVTLFVLADIPTDVNLSEISQDGILAASHSAVTSGEDRPEVIDTVVRKGRDRDEGVYRVRDYWLSSRKLVTVHSDDNRTHTGTILTYAIEIFIDGNSTGKSIDAIVLGDTIPTGTAYQAGSLRLDAASLSDPADGDAGSFDGSAIHVNVGTISGTAHKRVTFDVQIQ